MMSDNKVLKNTLQIERNKVSKQIRGVHITCCIVRAVISEATVGQKWNARVIKKKALFLLNCNFIDTLLDTPKKRKIGGLEVKLQA